jgi:hypothetical protein
MGQRLDVSGSRIDLGKMHSHASASPMMYRMPQVLRLPGADKFPDAQANKAILVAEQPVSTFSADVDTASYAFVRRQLATGRMPPLAAVRVEEMVNYFPHSDARPASRTQPFALTTEVMPSPWKADNQLLHIAVRGFDIEAAQQPPMNVVLLVDVSGSMGPQDRLPLLKQGLWRGQESRSACQERRPGERRARRRCGRLSRRMREAGADDGVAGQGEADRSTVNIHRGRAGWAATPCGVRELRRQQIEKCEGHHLGRLA